RGRRRLALRAASGRAVSARRLCRAAARSRARRGADAASAGARGDRVMPSPTEPFGSSPPDPLSVPERGDALSSPSPAGRGGQGVRTARPPGPGLERLSLNQITAERASLHAAVEACARHGIPHVGIWRHKLKEVGLDAAVRAVRDAGVRVSSVCRGGMFPAATREERDRRIEDNRRAIDEAAALGAPVLVLVCGAAPDRDIVAARHMVADGIAAIVDYAAERQVVLGVEPLHPAFAAERSCITTLREARVLAERFSAERVGVIADVYHMWWDPELYEEIERAALRLIGFHVN